MSDQLDRAPASENDSTPVAGRAAATISFVLFLSWVVIVILLHFLRPELHPSREFISDYATGPFGLLMSAAFLAWAFGLAALVVALFQGLPLRPRSWVSLILLSVSSFLMFLVGIYRGDPGDVIVSRSGEIHNISSLLFFLLLMIAMLVLSIRLRRARLLRGRYSVLLWLSIAAPIAFVLMMAVFDGAGMVGLGQRIFALTLIAWLLLLAWGVRAGGFGSRDVPQQ